VSPQEAIFAAAAPKGLTFDAQKALLEELLNGGIPVEAYRDLLRAGRARIAEKLGLKEDGIAFETDQLPS
jgi:hypothetical protein